MTIILISKLQYLKIKYIFLMLHLRHIECNLVYYVISN